MPTYEYVCRICGHQFEEFQSMTEKPLEDCPKCKGELKRLISGGAGVIFKGRGFHNTDYRSADYAADKAREEEVNKPVREDIKEID